MIRNYGIIRNPAEPLGQAVMIFPCGLTTIVAFCPPNINFPPFWSIWPVMLVGLFHVSRMAWGETPTPSREISSIFDQGGFRKAFARAENVDNLHFTRSIDAMDADRVLVHCVKADRRRALAEQAVVRRSPLKGRHQTHAKLKSILTFAFSAPLW